RTTWTTGSQWSGKAQTPDIAMAHCSVPVSIDLAVFIVDCHAVVHAVVHEDIGIGASTQRAVLVADYRSLVSRTVAVIVGPPGIAIHRGEIHRLGVFEGQLFD